MGFIFSERSIPAIVEDRKTQTRRLVKPGEQFLQERRYTFDDDDFQHMVLTAKGRIKWQIGKDYAVQPGRGKPGALWCPEQGIWRVPDADRDIAGRHNGLDWQPLRIRILDIQREDVRTICLPDAMDEGFNTRSEFWEVWCGFHDPAGLTAFFAEGFTHGLMERPNERYRAWALTFEVVRD